MVGECIERGAPLPRRRRSMPHRARGRVARPVTAECDSPPAPSISASTTDYTEFTDGRAAPENEASESVSFLQSVVGVDVRDQSEPDSPCCRGWNGELAV